MSKKNGREFNEWIDDVLAKDLMRLEKLGGAQYVDEDIYVIQPIWICGIRIAWQVGTKRLGRAVTRLTFGDEPEGTITFIANDHYPKLTRAAKAIQAEFPKITLRIDVIKDNKARLPEASH